MIEDLIEIFHKVSVNEFAGSHYCDPVIWGKTVASFHQPIASNSPGASGLYVPVFHILDALFGRVYQSALGVEALHLRSWFPRNWRDMIAAFEDPAVSLCSYCKEVGLRRQAGASHLPPLDSVYDLTVEAYAGDRGWLGIHRYARRLSWHRLSLSTQDLSPGLRARPPILPSPALSPASPASPRLPPRICGGVRSYKVYGFLTLVFKAGRSATNGKTMEANGNGWEAVHEQLDISRNERFSAVEKSEIDESSISTTTIDSVPPVALPPAVGWALNEPLARWMELERQQMEFFGRAFCSARITRRESICSDPMRRTARVVLTLTTKGLTYYPGDRLMVAPINIAGEVMATASALQRSSNDLVPLNGIWRKHFEDWSAGSKSAPLRGDATRVPLGELIRHGSLRPVFCEQVVALRDSLPQGSEQRHYVNSLIDSANWPISTSIEVLLNTLRDLGDACILDDATLCMVIPPARQRVYTISNAPPPPAAHHDELPSELHLTVTRSSVHQEDRTTHGVCSSLLNPPVVEDGETLGTELRVSVQRPLHYNLVGAHMPIVMMGAGSGIAPFIGFLQARERVSVREGTRTRNVLFFGCRDEESFLYRQQLHEMLVRDMMDLTIVVAFSREDKRCVCTAEKGIEILPRRVGKYVSDVVQSSSWGVVVSDAILSTEKGGDGAAFYICGSTKFYESLQRAMDKAISQYGFDPTVVVRDALSERRLMLEVFGDGSPPPPKPHKQPSSANPLARSSLSQISFNSLPAARFSSRVIRQSMLMMHSACSPVQGRFWVTLADKVYDLTDILDTHPGGRQIILDYAGDDVTRAFQLVSHAANAQVMARLHLCFVGSYHPLRWEKARKHLEAAQGRLDRHRALAALCEMMDIMSRHATAFVSFLNLFSIEREATLKMMRSCDSQREKLKVLLVFCERFHRDFYRILGQQVSEMHELVNMVAHHDANAKVDARSKALDQWKQLEAGQSLAGISSYLKALRGMLISSSVDATFVNSTMKRLREIRQTRMSDTSIRRVPPPTPVSRWHQVTQQISDLAKQPRLANIAVAAHSFANEVQLQSVNWDTHFLILEKFTSTCIGAAYQVNVQLSQALNELEVLETLVLEMTPTEIAKLQQDGVQLPLNLGLTEGLTQVMKHFYRGLLEECQAQLKLEGGGFVAAPASVLA
jgi:sulfite reductase alpha subunit-like flavoprotein